MKTTKYQQEVLLHINSITGNVPLHRAASRQTYSFSDKPFNQQLAIWDQVWHHNENFWVRVHAFFFLERHMKKTTELKLMWPFVMKWQDDVNDWPLCDALAKIYTKILVALPTEVYLQLKKWNKDQDLWKRRQSVVSLLYYSRTKKDHLPFHKITSLITPLLKDKEYYVQKGVGWALRELYTVYPRKAKPYFTTHIRSLSSIAFTIAIEKIRPAAKDKLKSLRR